MEATTARKGNRKVSLTVSGWVGEQVMWWDDGAEQNVYVTGLGSTLASHFKFTGQATLVGQSSTTIYDALSEMAPRHMRRAHHRRRYGP